jgi:DNA-binding NarL/FixJ family response regulator
MSPDRQPHASHGRHAIAPLIVDDHPAVRAEVRAMPTQQIDPRVIAETGSAEGTVTAVQSPPDVAVADTHLGGRNRLYLVR